MKCNGRSSPYSKGPQPQIQQWPSRSTHRPPLLSREDNRVQIEATEANIPHLTYGLKERTLARLWMMAMPAGRLPIELLVEIIHARRPVKAERPSASWDISHSVPAFAGLLFFAASSPRVWAPSMCGQIGLDRGRALCLGSRTSWLDPSCSPSRLL
ncbi:hypothetical protein C8F04DRAFT_1066706 [Mycena alexandri]|uniref:Uncharacterized protein n=1 Tax=Mycena alexandri TaxID=1745969 RepID=A0AAD6XFB4_9AGAR|nr:hypothetical protein C8F04DRAFT_1066706 [Mycena alexandri]